MGCFSVDPSLSADFLLPKPIIVECGAKRIGATRHYVTRSLDEGPNIEQDVVPVNHRDSNNEWARMGQDVKKVCCLAR